MSEIKIYESTVDERRIRSVLDKKQIFGLIAAAVASQAGVDLSAENVHIRTLHLSSRMGSTDSEYEAVCEIVVDRRPQDAAGSA